MEIKNIYRIAEYFREGCKRDQIGQIGVEIEHFVMKGTKDATYEEVVNLLSQVYGVDAFFYYEDENYAISLEPGAQLEVSIFQREQVEQLAAIYEGFLDRIRPYLVKEGMHLLTLGYRPYAKADAISLIPKKRYQYMNEYFMTTGDHGVQMMRGSAATQVAIDYYDEDDFRRKYQLAECLTPVLAMLTEFVKQYEGQPVQGNLTRMRIWEDVDPYRCGIVPGSMSSAFSFMNYAQYVYHVPLILVIEQGVEKYVGATSAAEYYQDREMTISEIEHMISMVFPDVRLKKYLELRVADSMPGEYVFAYCQLIKNVFYNENSMDRIEQFLGRQSEEAIAQAKTAVMEQGREASLYGKSVEEIFSIIRQISPEEMIILERGVSNEQYNKVGE